MNATLKVNDVVKTTGGTKTYRIVAIADVFGIPAADLVLLRKKDGREGVVRGRRLKNLPLSCLEPIGKPLTSIL